MFVVVLGVAVAVQFPPPVARGQAVDSATAAASTRTGDATNPSDRLLLLIPTLTGEGTTADRHEAAAAILRLGTEDAVKAVTGILKLKNNNAAKLAICAAVGEMDSPPAALAEPLLALLQQQKDPQIHDAVVPALSRFTDPSISGRLKDFLEQEELEWLRSEHVARSRELYGLLPKESDRIGRLQTWLKAAQPVDRLTALEIVHGAMLATTPTPPAKEVLQQIRQMLRDPDEDVRRKCVAVLRDLQEKEDAARILGMLEHERSPVVLEEIYKALGRMGDPEATGACIKGLRNPNEDVASGAADALGRLCRVVNGKVPPNAALAVTAILERANEPMGDKLREQLVTAMAQIADRRFLPILAVHAKPDEKVAQVRQAAIAGIGQIGDPEQVDLVIAGLSEDPDPGVREAAAEALGKLGNKPAHLRPLVLHLADASQAVQNKAWAAYRQVVGRLTWEERRQAFSAWTGEDKVSTGRRIDLLTDMESQAAAAKNDPGRLVDIREELGDALLTSGEYALAAAAFARAAEGMTAEQAGRRLPLTVKLLNAYLRVPAYDKAMATAAAAQSPQAREALAEQLFRFVENLAKTDPRGAVDCIDRFRASSPDLFNGDWGARFDGLRRSTTQPASTLPGG
ncbi:MAG: HEAT repeat domain-containing protein [Planctomycetes bacterium]|nr:HEAT repeat domain-containing protein [Planctomycetota bacterium]